jgi:hypothetical protein
LQIKTDSTVVRSDKLLLSITSTAILGFESHVAQWTSAALQSKKKSAVTALTMVIDFAPIPIISQLTFFGCLTTDAFAGFCPTDLPDRF